ncbi:MAG: HDIG domain-containing protein [Kofleriaceae bacterium]
MARWIGDAAQVIIAAIVTAVAAAAAALFATRRAQGAQARAALAAEQAAARAQVASAQVAAAAVKQAAETAARTELLATRTAADAELNERHDRAAQREAALSTAAAELAAVTDELEQREAALAADEQDRRSKGDRARGLETDAARRARELHAVLEARAGVTADLVVRELVGAWTEQAQAQAQAQIRAAGEAATDPASDREAKRVMEIASGRYQNHFLTERNLTNIRLEAPVMEVVLAQGGIVHAALEEIGGVKVIVADDQTAVRLDGQDSLGREVVRRVLAKLGKRPESAKDALAAPAEFVTKIKEHLDGEVKTLGKKAFATLGVPKAHPEITWLVGALNWRTSYTQNQWLHAVEASFLAGMMAAELGLDEKLARRATLMHDIGKALTHKIEGSHAVIGADIARRLGEPELVANAIGSHHADEPPNSVYAYLVAAADAMSGARPGARREQTEGFSTKVDDLERIGVRHRGVEFAHAVHGGRELRVYVRERDVDDAGVVELSSEIAAQVSDEMTFPGQIKVTVIRSFEAVATAN